MIAIKKKLARRNKIRARIRSRVSGTAAKPRLSVFRSNSHIYAQLIDDLQGVTLASASSFKTEGGGPRAASSRVVGLEIAKAGVAAGVSEVIFDRGGYLFHGRVKALAEGAREGGLKF